MEEVLIAYLLNNAGLSALVGTRIYWDNRPPDDGDPAVVLRNLGGPVDYHMEGSSRLREARLQVECWSNETPAAALAVRRAVEGALSGLQANLSGIDIWGAFVDGLNQAYQHFTEGAEDAYLYRVDFLLWHET